MMEFIATNWYIWLAVVVLGYGYVLFNQVRRIKGIKSMMTDSSISMFDDAAKNNFFKGIGMAMVAGALGFGGMVLLVIATIINIMNYSAG